jgi:hypothetical protein
MPFEKGNKHGKGRPLGAMNKLNADSREKLHEIYEKDLLKKFKEDLKKLSPRERVQAFLKLTEFFVPKLRSEHLQVDLDSVSDQMAGKIISEVLEQTIHDESKRRNTKTAKRGDKPAADH